MVSDTVHQALICHAGKRRLQILTPTIQTLRSSLRLPHYGFQYPGEVRLRRLVRPSRIRRAPFSLTRS